MSRDDDFSFRIAERIGTIGVYATGWKKEVNLVEWNGHPAKIDVRDWDPKHEHMSRGVTLKTEEAAALSDVLSKYLARERAASAQPAKPQEVAERPEKTQATDVQEAAARPADVQEAAAGPADAQAAGAQEEEPV